MSYFQLLFDKMSEDAKNERANSQMTLGMVISRLEELPGDLELRDIGFLMSYRGYYSDLAFDIDHGKTKKVSEVLQECRSSMGKFFTGYKGGEFLMGEKTPMWVAQYGSIGERLMSITDDGVFVTEDEQ